MKNGLLVAFLAFAFAALGGEIEDSTKTVIRLLGSEDFEVRCAATNKLSLFGEEYIEKFLRLSKEQDDPEIAERLRMAARRIFEAKVAVRDERWLKLYGDLGVEFNSLYNYSSTDGSEAPKTYVSFVAYDGDAENKVKHCDLVLEVNGEKLGEHGECQSPLAGREYVVKLRRYKNTEHLANTMTIDQDDKDYEDLTVSIKVGWKEERFISKDEKESLLLSLWAEFNDKRKAK
jgi:hypothetical protein